MNKAWLGRLICVVGTGVAVALVWHRLDFSTLRATFRNVQPGWYAAALLSFGALFVPAAMRWQLVARLTGCSVHFGAACRTAVVGHFFTLVLFGVAGGDVAKAALYSRWYRLPLPEVLATAALDRLLSFGGLLLLGLAAVVLAALNGAFSSGTRLELSAPWLGAAVAAGAVGLIVLLKWRPAGQSGPARWLRTFGDGVRRLASVPRDAVPGLATAFLVQVCLSGALALNLAAVSSQPLPWARLAWTFPLITVMSGLPITVAGLGVREGAALFLFGLYGVPAADAVAAALLTLTANLFWVLMGGIVQWREEELFARHAGRPLPESISVVIPALNEEADLPETIRRARHVPEVTEILVVDGGSRDRTVELARALGCRVLTSPPGRGRQLQLGAAAAQGDVVLFLHADTWLPSRAGEAVRRCLHDTTVVGGALWKAFRDPGPLMRGSRFRCWIRMAVFQTAYGDQAIFVRREVLEEVGGVPPMPLMEELELGRRLQNVGRLALAPATVRTSARRFARLGVLRTYFRMGAVLFRYKLGASPEELARLYERK
jgi:rSAM/selenodomain-associated transferase 2